MKKEPVTPTVPVQQMVQLQEALEFDPQSTAARTEELGTSQAPEIMPTSSVDTTLEADPSTTKDASAIFPIAQIEHMHEVINASTEEEPASTSIPEDQRTPTEAGDLEEHRIEPTGEGRVDPIAEQFERTIQA